MALTKKGGVIVQKCLNCSEIISNEPSKIFINGEEINTCSLDESSLLSVENDEFIYLEKDSENNIKIKSSTSFSYETALYIETSSK